MQRLEVSCAVRLIYMSLGAKVLAETSLQHSISIIYSTYVPSLFSITALHSDISFSYLGTLRSVVQVEMALREWLRKQTPISTLMKTGRSLEEEADVWSYWVVLCQWRRCRWLNELP